jgi:hypothetical protein
MSEVLKNNCQLTVRKIAGETNINSKTVIGFDQRSEHEIRLCQSGTKKSQWQATHEKRNLTDRLLEEPNLLEKGNSY